MEVFTKLFRILLGYTLFFVTKGFHNDPKCGLNYSRRSKIIGGENVKEAEFPWFVSIKETGRYECGGFIINKRAVLTASHCFRHFSDRVAASPQTLSVTLAVHNFNGEHFTQKETSYELDVKVKKIERHPYYNASSNSGKFDIALLLLEDEIQWNSRTRPVCLPTTKSSHTQAKSSVLTEKENVSSVSNDYEDGEIAVVAGWPSAESNGKPSILQKVRLKLYSNEECERVLKEKNVTINIDSSLLCAGSNDIGKDSCSGDSGSALLIQRGKVWVAIGIVSSGFGPCGKGIPGLYTRIASYMEWIDDHNKPVSPKLLSAATDFSLGKHWFGIRNKEKEY